MQKFQYTVTVAGKVVTKDLDTNLTDYAVRMKPLVSAIIKSETKGATQRRDLAEIIVDLRMATKLTEPTKVKGAVGMVTIPANDHDWRGVNTKLHEDRLFKSVTNAADLLAWSIAAVRPLSENPARKGLDAHIRNVVQDRWAAINGADVEDGKFVDDAMAKRFTAETGLLAGSAGSRQTRNTNIISHAKKPVETAQTAVRILQGFTGKLLADIDSADLTKLLRELSKIEKEVLRIRNARQTGAAATDARRQRAADAA